MSIECRYAMDNLCEGDPVVYIMDIELGLVPFCAACMAYIKINHASMVQDYVSDFFKRDEELDNIYIAQEVLAE